MYVYYNANPSGKATGDCVIRAISTITGLPWRTVHWELATLSNEMYQMMDDNVVWHEYLRRLGFDIHMERLHYIFTQGGNNMSLTDNNNGMVMPVSPMYGGNGCGVA